MDVVLILDSAESLHPGQLWGDGLTSFMDAIGVLRRGRPWLFVLLVVHLNKLGQARKGLGARRDLEDVPGNIARTADVVMLLESAGQDRMRLSVHKRVPSRQVILRRADGVAWHFEAEASEARSSKVSQEDVVTWVRSSGTVDVKDAADKFDVHPKTARRWLEEAVSAGLLVSTPPSERPTFSEAVRFWLPEVRD